MSIRAILMGAYNSEGAKGDCALAIHHFKKGQCTQIH
jgi:hypothetical protein